MKSTYPSKIALVDNHIIIRNCLAECLKVWGYSVVIQASNGQHLFDQLTKENAPDICVLEIDMPEMNGHETIVQLKLKWPGIKILVFSLDVEDKYAIISEMGANEVLSKLASAYMLQKVLEQLKPKNPFFSN